MRPPPLYLPPNHILDLYVEAHPELKRLYHTDTLTHSVMQSCANEGLALPVMLFRLTMAQITARLEVENRYRAHLESSSFFPIPEVSLTDGKSG